MVRFGDVVSNVNENTRDPRSLGLDRVVGLDHLDPESLPLRRWDLLEEMPDGTSFTRTFKAGQVLFGKRRAYQRKVAVPDFSGICSGDILVFESSTEDLLQAFLPYVVQSAGFFDHALGTSAGSLSPRTKWQELAKYEFALPPIDEQERIVDLLRNSDFGIETLSEVVRRGLILARSVFEERVEESGVPPFLLKDYASLRRGYSFRGTDYSGETGHAFMTLASVRKGGGYRDEGIKYVKNAPKSEDRVKSGDLLIANTDLTPGREFIGRPFLVPEEMEGAGFSHHLSRVCLQDESLGQWLFWEMQTKTSRRFVRSRSRGSTVIMLDMKGMGEWPIRVPDAEIRNQILKEVGAAVETAASAETVATFLRLTRRTLLNELLGVEPDVH